MWALDDARARLLDVSEAIHKLEGRPDLTWYPTLRGSHNKVRGGLPDTSRPVILREGDEHYTGDGRPSYAREYQRRMEGLTAIRTELERAIAAYEGVLATWSPEKYPVTGVAPRQETVHLSREITHPRLGKYTGIGCRACRPGGTTAALPKTTDPAGVTCRRCRALLGLPAQSE